MTRQAQRWLRWGVAVVAFTLWTAPAAAAAGLAERTAAWTERIGERIQTTPDPVAGLSDAELAGQRIVVGFDGTSAPEAVLRRGYRLKSIVVKNFDETRAKAAALLTAVAAPEGALR